MADNEPKPAAADTVADEKASYDMSPTEEILSPKENKRLLRRADMCFQYLDKSTMANAAILGLREDLHLKGQEYSWASSLFNFGYLAASAPIAVIMVKLPIARFMSVSVILWGTILMCMATPRAADGLMATRFFLGFTEAAVAPGFSIIISLWYRRSEQPIRNGIWFLGNVVSGFFAGPLMYAFGHIHAYPAWKVVFLVFGGLTVLWGSVLFFLLPNGPSQAWFISEEDRKRSVLRICDDSVGVKHDTWKMDQMWEALRDPKAWMTALIMLAVNIPNGGISNFAAIVIHGFGFTVNETFLVNMIVTAFQAFFVLVATLGSTYLRNTRTVFMTSGAIIGLVGAVIIRQLDNSNIWARYSGYCLLSAYTVNFPLVLVMNTANNAGITKKTTVNAMSFVAYCAGNIIGPQLFFARESPSYPSGFAAMLVCFVFVVFTTLGLRFYLIWENSKRDRAHGEGSAEDDHTAEELSGDKTDGQISSFRYVY